MLIPGLYDKLSGYSQKCFFTKNFDFSEKIWKFFKMGFLSKDVFKYKIGFLGHKWVLAKSVFLKKSLIFEKILKFFKIGFLPKNVFCTKMGFEAKNGFFAQKGFFVQNWGFLGQKLILTKIVFLKKS